MDVNKVVSLGKSSQSIGTQGIGILVFNDDRTCNNIVAEMLQHCSYQVLHIGGVLDVLNAIWETKDRLDLVLTNAHKLDSNGTEIVQHIQKKLDLPVILMSPDKRKIESKGQPFSFAAYILNGLSRNDVNNLWQFALEKEKDKMVTAHQEENVHRASISGVAFETNKTSSSISDAARLNQKCKGVELRGEKGEGSKKGQPTAKKPRVVWTNEMHQRFMEAIKILGHEKAVPKKIVEVMDIPGLTRENVASHLQKFRGSNKRPQETGRKEFEGLGVFSSPPALRLNSLQTNMTALPRSSYMSTAKESISPSKSQYLNTRKDLSFGTTSERKNYTSIGGSPFSDPRQKYVPKLQFTSKFRIYGDQMRNMLLSVDKNSSSDNSNQFSISKFVGYRVTSDGKSIEYGSIEAAVDKINTEALVYTRESSENQSTSYIHHHSISDQNPLMPTECISQQPALLGNPACETSFQCQSVSEIYGIQNPTQSISTSDINSSHQLTFLSSHSPIIENQIQCPSTPLSSTSKQHNSPQPLGASGNADTEKCLPLLDQDISIQFITNAVAVQNQSENDITVQHASTSSSIFPRDQYFFVSPLDILGSNFPVENPVAFLEGISQQHYSPSSLPQKLLSDDFLDEGEIDDALVKGTGSTSPLYDLEDFDDTLFRHDD